MSRPRWRADRDERSADTLPAPRGARTVRVRIDTMSLLECRPHALTRVGLFISRCVNTVPIARTAIAHIVMRRPLQHRRRLVRDRRRLTPRRASMVLVAVTLSASSAMTSVANDAAVRVNHIHVRDGFSIICG